jgi:hypothetical protein
MLYIFNEIPISLDFPYAVITVLMTKLCNLVFQM